MIITYHSAVNQTAALPIITISSFKIQMPAKAHHQHNTTGSRSSDYSFLQSLASIHIDSSHKMTPSHPRRHSTHGNCKSGTRVSGVPSRPATLGDTAPLIRPVGEDQPFTPPPRQVHSILKTKQDAQVYGPSQQRVSFTGGTISRSQSSSPTSVTSSTTNSLSLKVPAPPLPFGVRTPSSEEKKDDPPETFQRNPPIENRPKKQLKLYCSRRDDYALGEKARSSSHMMSAICPQSVYQLKNYDFAFVKRSNGSWTYAILAYRSRGSSYEEEHMMFVLDEEGSSKVIVEKDWARYIRCLVESDDQSQ